MNKRNRPIGFWILIVFIGISIALMLVGQTASVFDYDFTVRNGLQESEAQVSAYGVQVNRAFGAGDTVVYVPLLLASLIGLWKKKHWALVTTAAAGGVGLARNLWTHSLGGIMSTGGSYVQAKTTYIYQGTKG